jgi:hypothetical protein
VSWPWLVGATAANEFSFVEAGRWIYDVEAS